MDSEIKRIKSPLDKYSAFQEKIAAEIRKIGGNGHIHGCIIDIDWENHIYVNPVDLKIQFEPSFPQDFFCLLFGQFLPANFGRFFTSVPFS